MLGDAFVDLARLLVGVHVQRQRVFRRVPAELDEPFARARAHGVGCDADADSGLAQALEISQVVRDRVLAEALYAAARVRDVEHDELDAHLVRGLRSRPCLLEPQVVELAHRRVPGPTHLGEDSGVIGADAGRELEHRVPPSPEVRSFDPAAQRPLESVAVRIDEAGDLEIIRHVRDNTHGCVASSRGGS